VETGWCYKSIQNNIRSDLMTLSNFWPIYAAETNVSENEDKKEVKSKTKKK
jgi:hypothetical protein